MNMMKTLGHNLEFIIIYNTGSIGKKEFMTRIRRLVSTSNKSKSKKIRVVLNAYKMIKRLMKLK